MSKHFMHPAWIGALAFLLCLLPVLVHYDKTEPTRIMENLSIMSSQETWLRQHAGEKDAWVIPSYNGAPRIHKPPLLVWVNLLAWADLSPDTADLMRLVGRARLVSVGLAWLTLLSVFWAGHTLGGWRYGLLGVVATGTQFLFIRQARFATYDNFLLGWGTLAVAAGLWAMAPAGGRGRGRAILGWLVSGGAMGAALMSKGPLALALILGPLAAMAWGVPPSPGGLRRRLTGLVGAALLALALAAPWYGHVLHAVSGAATRMLSEYEAQRNSFQPPWYYLGLIGLVFPWSFWMLDGLRAGRPSRTEPGARRGAAPWLWFVFIFVFMSIPMAKQQRYILPILPAAGLLAAAALIRREGELPRAGWYRFAVAAHWGLLRVLSVLGPLTMLLQERLVAWGWMKEPQVPGIPVGVTLALGVALCVVAWHGGRLHREGRAIAAAAWTAVWMAALSSVAFYGYALSSHGRFAYQAEAHAAAQTMREAPFYYLNGGRAYDKEPSKEMLMYERLTVPALTPAQLAEKLAAGERLILLERQGDRDEASIEPPSEGLEFLGTFRDGEKYKRRQNVWRLYRHPRAERPAARPADG